MREGEKGQVILISITKEELKELIEVSVQKIISASKNLDTNIGEYMNIKEAASFLKLAPQTIYGLTSKRLIPFVKKSHKIIFIQSDLSKWVLE